MTLATQARSSIGLFALALTATGLPVCATSHSSGAGEAASSSATREISLPTTTGHTAASDEHEESALAETHASPPPATEGTLAIASWNLRRLGQGTERDEATVAAILDRFDLVALQEVMTRESIASLLVRLPGWQALLTDAPLPRTGSPHREYYAFIFREERLVPLLNTTVPDPEDAFVREPFLGCFRVRSSSSELCLLTIHVTYGSSVEPRKAEILALDDALRWAQQTREDEAGWVVLGDFNRVVDDGDADREPEEEWRELLATGGWVRPVELAGPELPTTLGTSDWSQSYDHVFISRELGRGLVDAGRVDIVGERCGGGFEECRRRLSDHAPVFVIVKIPP